MTKVKSNLLKQGIGGRIFFRVCRDLAIFICRVYFRMSINGMEHVPKNGAYVMAPNHRSNLDIVVIGGTTRRRQRYMGKDTLWAPWIWSVCGPGQKNRGLLDNDTLNSQWGYQLECEILIINELKEPEARERRALANKLKPIIAAPPDMLPINRKGLHPYDMMNRLSVIAFTNDPVPLSIDSQDRRWFCVWSHAPRMEPDEAASLWAWYKSGGFDAIAAWLHARDVSAFNPGAAPMMTEFKANLVEHGMSMAESYLVEMIRNRLGEFAAGVVGSPFHSICDRLAGSAPSGVKVPQAALLHALQEAGWRDVGRIASFEFKTKKHMFAAPDVAQRYNKSDLRRMVEEQSPGAKLRAVK